MHNIEIWENILEKSCEASKIFFSIFLNHYLHKKKIEPKSMQRYPTGYI